MTRPGLATISLDPRGGGIARVSQLIWRVLGDQWGPACRLATLAPGGAVIASTIDRVRFGAELAAMQLPGQCSWMFYTHLGIAKAQSFVPRPIRKPYGVFLHGIEAWRPLSRSDRRVVARAAVLVANSAYTARRVAEAHPWIGPIVPCPLALAPHSPRGGPDAADLVPGIGPRSVLVVARMSAAERYKGHDQLIDAWPAVLARTPDAQLVFVGAGDDVMRLQAKVAASGVSTSVIFTGFVSDAALDDLYRSAALLAMPSRDEGLGVVYLEAMARGLPCIGSIHDAATEVIDDGVTGYLVDQADTVSLADRMTRLLTDDDRRREMGERGRARLQQHFTYELFRDRFLSLVSASFGGRPTTAAPAVGAATEWGRSRS